MKRPKKTQFRTIGADDRIIQELERRRAELEKATGRRISLTETLRRVLNLEGGSENGTGTL